MLEYFWWDLEGRRIEGLDKYCRRLRILYLQDNAIQRLENLHRLKYLGMASGKIFVISTDTVYYAFES